MHYIMNDILLRCEPAAAVVVVVREFIICLSLSVRGGIIRFVVRFDTSSSSSSIRKNVSFELISPSLSHDPSLTAALASSSLYPFLFGVRCVFCCSSPCPVSVLLRLTDRNIIRNRERREARIRFLRSKKR